MARYTGPKNRIARRFGVNVFGRARNPLLHKANPPGVHGAKRKKKSDFGVQLEEQQKLKACYGMISQKQLVRYYQEAAKAASNTPQEFIQKLETRLDVIVYRLKFAATIFGAQQLVSHGHILVNGKKVDRRSFHVKPGMTISVREKSQKMEPIQAALKSGQRSLPEYVSLNEAGFSGQLLSLPAIDQIPFPLPLNIPLICEFLAHNS
ncbi:MAG: 30S ribosomal protein S4 [Rhabdochlamydiaceae bacterium]